MSNLLELTDKHKEMINSCVVSCGSMTSLAKETGLSSSTIKGLCKDRRRVFHSTWIAIVSYARKSGVVGPFFDPITLTEPPLAGNLDESVHDAAWMLQRLPDEDRKRLETEIAAAYGKFVARERDGQTTIA